ncbi:hypothetical protein [Candidatus Spongiihabitans sp.]|uniref:hypothetical protein n=1 Tax=Candidatus Spongiihabitans sp. TaxID=3101308 RepID=UPI003C6EF80D
MRNLKNPTAPHRQEHASRLVDDANPVNGVENLVSRISETRPSDASGASTGIPKRFHLFIEPDTQRAIEPKLRTGAGCQIWHLSESENCAEYFDDKIVPVCGLLAFESMPHLMIQI